MLQYEQFLVSFYFLYLVAQQTQLYEPDKPQQISSFENANQNNYLALVMCTLKIIKNTVFEVHKILKAVIGDTSFNVDVIQCLYYFEMKIIKL